MPLTAIDEPGEVDAFGVRFTMEQRGERIRCHVFRSAITGMADSTMIDNAALLTLFQSYRLLFEQMANNLFDAGHKTPWIEAIVTTE